MQGQILKDIYRIKSHIKKSHKSCVFSAKNLTTDENVAIKIVDKTYEKSFRQELSILQNLKTKHTVKLLDNGYHNNNGFLILEFLEGFPLFRAIPKNKGLKSTEAIKLFMQICDAVANIHNQNIIHLDIKPSNIILLQNDTRIPFKIIDFSIAQQYPYEKPIDHEGNILGTPSYAAPELILDKKLGPQCDIYSLGALFSFILSGCSPYSSGNTISILAKQLKSKPQNLFTGNLKHYEKLQTIILKSMHLDKTLRYQSIKELLQNL